MNTLAIIVNYKSAALAQKAVRSVLDSESLGPVQVVVVDNSEDRAEAERLRAFLPSRVALYVNLENVGFGRACNFAFEEFCGEQILLINPDAKLLPGCLLRLQKTLESKEKIGAVSSQIFWDDSLRFYLPFSYPLPQFGFQAFSDSWGPWSHISRIQSAIWRYHSIKVWRSKKPVRVNNLSGGLVLLKRSAAERAGGLFDPRFFLYFEDTDLFIRLRKAGYSLLVEPAAKAIHHYDQCGQGNLEQKRLFMDRSCSLLLEKHRRGARLLMGKIVSYLVPHGNEEKKKGYHQNFKSPFMFTVPVPLQAGWLFEVSPNPNFIPCAARFGRGPIMEFPEECWNMLAPGRYFGRLGYPEPTGKCVEAMTLLVA